MSRKFVAFDIETVKEFPGADWRPHRPLGIACAATRCTASPAPTYFYGKSSDGSPSGRLSTDDARRLVEHLCDLVAQEYTIVTWNGLGFDFDILAEESGELERCRRLAIDHVDMMFQVVCENGFRVGLAKAAEGLGVSGKSMEGRAAPKLWRAGRRQEVLDYVGEDVRIVLQIAEKAEKGGRLRWVTQRGGKKHMRLRNGWLTVRECERLPLPDTSWMDAPVDRRTYVRWLHDEPPKLPRRNVPRNSSLRR